METEIEPKPKRSSNLLIFIVGLVMLVLGFLLGFAGRPTITEALSLGPTATPDPRDEMMTFLVENTNHFRGPEDAPVTIIEFSDFQ